MESYKFIRPDTLKKIINTLFFIFILSFILPSGMILGLPLQKFLFLSICLVYFIFFLLEDKEKIDFKSLGQYYIFFISLIIWALIGKFSGYENSFQVFNGLALPVIIFFVFLRFQSLNLIESCILEKAFLILILCKVFFKIMIEVLCVFNIFNINQIMTIYLNIFNTELTTMTVNVGNFIFLRLMHSGDYMVVAIFILYLLNKRYSTKYRILIWFLVGFFTLIVYSRFNLVQYIILSILFFISIFKDLSKRQKCLLFLTCFMGILIFLPYFLDLFKQRFLSVDNTTSDMIRNQQTQVLINSILQKPLFGYGLGAYISDFIRSTSNVFSYEKEYYSFLLQTGVIGFILIFINMLVLFIKPIFQVYKESKNYILNLAVLINILFFIARPFFNPGFVGLNNWIIFILFLIMGNSFIFFDKRGENDDFCSNGNI